ncbi:MAG: Formylglycine-generating sulfatase enzyme [Planctomycetes bacterium ADurb.Bin126]|nr:MAG: Formylglycine-generating sulfatase enzyme [Planctomycetes bacterium ADurb.Bin126]HOD81876.1 SUMF1/EgtB/PvdO family nonheme iron enzyme [Phycisphaerae bacterium]
MKHSHWMTALLLAALALSLSAATAAPVMGRYVRVTLPGDDRTLSLAEVQVFSRGANVALKCPAVQTSTDHGGDPARAVDGKTDGEWSRGTITHTVEGVSEPAWEVNLGELKAIEKIVLWNRDNYENRLDRAVVQVLDDARKVVAQGAIGKAGGGAITVALSPGKGEVLAAIKPGADKPRNKKVARRDQKSAGKPAGEGGSSFGTPASLRLAVQDLMATFGPRYPKGADFLKRLAALEPKLASGQGQDEFAALQKEALLANPLIDFDKILLVRRSGSGGGLPANWQGNSSLKKNGYDNEIAILSPLNDGEVKTVYKPEKGEFVGDVDLHFDADRMLFSTIGKNGAWAVGEVKVDGTGYRQVSPDEHADIDYYDPVYLPSGKIICDSTSGYQGVPCVSGSDYVANLHVMDANGKNIRRLCFEQDNDWCPVMMDNGRVLFLRWEYTDSAHYFSRVLFHMNPDGTDQKAFYGSNSYWPNSLFYARPVPGSNTKFVGIVTGHHGVRRMGELVLFDAGMGRFEADGAVQRIPGYGKKVEAITKDTLVDGSWPKFLHPYPLSEKYHLASMLPAGNGRWGIYLVDVFDNLVLLKDVAGYSLYEPVPVRKTPKPFIVADKVDPKLKDAFMYMTDIYAGPGLKDVPRGKVKALRVYKYEYSLRNVGGHYDLGMEGPWDAHIILGTVPLEADGSVMFRIPANTPVAFQPIDAEGKALQLMRSWTVGMPGEVVSCVGCHEDQNVTSPNYNAIAAKKLPQGIAPWRGPARGFSFIREVQPVLDKYCVGCHDGQERSGRKDLPDFADTGKHGRYYKSYMALHPYVRRNGPEGDYHLLTPLEFHADTSELVQMLSKGHHNVKLDAEAWDRLITWIDLNVPALGTWTERGAKPNFVDRRKELARLYANVQDDPEVIVNPYERTEKFVPPPAESAPPAAPKVPGWPMTKEQAKQAQGQGGLMTLDMGNQVALRLARIPAGQFPMGSSSETAWERPVTPVKIEKPYWIGASEVTLKQYRQFDPTHQNGIYDRHYKDQVNRGYVMDADEDFPVIRVTWDEAMAFCKWLSAKTGKKVTLPTEAQWEWACRAGTDTPLSFGDFNTDFSTLANLADVKMKECAVSGVDPKPIKNPGKDVDFIPKDIRFNDGVLHLAKVASYAPNAWGLHDMHGNVAEWTRSAWMPYPYNDADGRNGDSPEKRVIRGGSWRDRQHRSTSSYRLAFPRWQKVYNVGFRVVVEQ